MKNLKKLFFTIVIASSCAILNAVPGINQIIPLSSGEFVYYRDTTFSREAVFGILFYDEGTYALRFYAPATKTEAEKDISVYITINPENPLIEFTGEKIIGAYAEEDSEIINYLHDIFYEFAARRQKVIISDMKDSPQTLEQEYQQFGGDVKITFDSQIPIFNIKEIATTSGKKLISVETIGKITGTQDTCFSSYKGIASVPKDKKRNFKHNKKAKKVTMDFENTQFTIYDEWTEYPGYWFLDEYAMLSVAIFPIPEGFSKEAFLFAFDKATAQSASGSYALLSQKTKKEDKDGKISISNVFVQPATEDVTRDFKVLIPCGDNMAYLSLTVFDSVYKNNKSYFDDLLKSFQLK